jgi:hypothetical protein
MHPLKATATTTSHLALALLYKLWLIQVDPRVKPEDDGGAII